MTAQADILRQHNADINPHALLERTASVGRMPRMNTVALTHHTGVHLAEVGFLLILLAGIWLAAAQVPQFKHGTARNVVAGVALALAGLLLIIATHWGHFA
jgi:hypothetical protein